MSQTAYILAGITYYVVSIVIIVIILNLINNKEKKKYQDEINALEIDKNLIISSIILSELNKVEALVNNEKMQETFDDWKDRFTEIKLDVPDDIRKLPAGSVVVYEKGACDYSETFGHVFIATGDGRGVSDFLEQNPRLTTADFNKVSIYIPTKKSTQA